MAAARADGAAIINHFVIHHPKTKHMAEETQNQGGQEQNNQKKSHALETDSMNTGGSENASANRGGTTDLDEEALTVRRSNATERGSGISTKNAVTGSDFDGQVSP
jgi:hypothetical protein